MYFYIFDSFTTQSKYQKKISQINSKLEALGIADEKENASPLRPIEMILKDALASNKYTNIIAVGDDQTATQIINILAASGGKTTFGIIPLRTSTIAKSLGLPEGAAACQEISARKLKRIDLGKINNQYFLTSAEIQAPKGGEVGSFFNKFLSHKNTEIVLDFNKFIIRTNINYCSIINIPQQNSPIKINSRYISDRLSPDSGLLNIFLSGKQTNKEIPKNVSETSFLQANKFKLLNKNNVKVTADGQTFNKNLITFESMPRCLEVIVGKNRRF